MINMTFFFFKVVIITLLYILNFIKTAIGSEGSFYPSNRIFLIILIIPFTSLASVHKFTINIICNSFANNSLASNPFTISELTLLALYLPVYTA